jgi:outer membrane protein assembly factor BamB
MVNQPHARPEGTRGKGLKQKRSSTSNTYVDEQPTNSNELNTLRNLLWSSLAVEDLLWTFRTKDWVQAISAADIDNDGDMEILICSRDGYVCALTRRGAVKWETYFAGEQLSTLYPVPLPLRSEAVTPGPQRPISVIVGTRSGKVMALDPRGERVPNWEYDTDRIIRKIYISDKNPESIIIGSEDRCIHILDRDTGKPRYAKVQTDGWVRTVFACDIDGDGRDEILAGSGDRHLYILDDQGTLLDKLNIGYQIYSLFAAPLEVGGPVHVVTSSNRKDLVVWHITHRTEKRWAIKKVWEKSPKEGLLGNRVHSICMADINKDGHFEIMLGAEDAHLYILDYQGTLLWKHRFRNCVYSVDAKDINFDNQIEILVGTEDSSAYALQIDLTDKLSHLYNHIVEGYQSLEARNGQSGNEMIIEALTTKERTILKEFIKNTHVQQHAQMEMLDAINLMKKRFYEEALAIFLRLAQEKVQYYWAQPLKTQGYIWTLDFAKIATDGKYDIVVGTDQGEIYAFDTEKAEDKQLWATHVKDRVRILQAGALAPTELDSIVAVLASHRVVILDHNGKIVKDHTFEDKQDWARSVYLNKHGSDSNPVSDMVIGLENNQVAIWDNHLQKKIRVIDTPQGISTAVTCDLPEKNTTLIISGSLKNHVYVHDWEGNELWRFETQDRVQELCVADIDKDGHIEVIVGAEDRYVYVLDDQGHLKWRYRTMRGVIDVDVCDMKMENDPDDEHERKLKLLVSSSDGYLYVFNAKGDLLWKYQSHNRIRSARATDVNNDGRYEIALATENQLELLQIINRKELQAYIQQCWQELEDPDDHRGSIIRLTRHPNEYIRGFALARLAGQRQRHQDDFKRLQEALRDDDWSEVKKELVRAIINLCQVAADIAQYRKENISLARLLIQKLSLDPDPEIRLAIVDVLAFMANVEEGLCFEYLEYFAHNIDAWVRRAVVRQLDKLVERYPERAFRLLLKTATDEDEWIRQETGRVLAHYFDQHPQVLIRDMLTLLYKRVDLVVLRQIADSAWVPAIADLFDSLFKLLTTEDVSEMIHNFVAALQTANQLEPFSCEALLQLYEEFHQFLHTKTVNTIARYQWITANSDITGSIPYQNIAHILHVFNDLTQVVEIVKTYERRETMGDRATSLFAATEALEKIRIYMQQEEMRQSQGDVKTYTLPEYRILTTVLAQWYKAITVEFHHLRGGARLVGEIRNNVVRPEEEIVISLRISNTGHSPADNVHIVLEESDDFLIVGNNTRSFSEISTSKPVTTDFALKPCVPSPRLSFQIIYDDAEKKAKIGRFADIITIQGQQRPFRTIPNPYTSGTPIRDRVMFFGRKDDIEDLYEKLSSTSANKVVVLYGQRRMGKTSLLYQLAKKLADGPYAPVLIDFQSLALKTNVGQFLFGIATHIHDELRHYKHIEVIAPDSVAFNSNPTTAFDNFLQATLQAIPDCKLVFLLDEFEKLYDLIQKGLLEENILNYLRSLMQHRERLNFLLAGTPHILDLTEGYWAIFFNIALQHPLSKLKPQEAIDLITQPISDYMEYDALALERMRYLSGDQPYLIHIISEKLIAHCNKHEKTYVTVNDVNTVLEHILYEQAISIRWIWKQSSPDERFLLSILAQEKDEEGRAFSLNDIRMEYDREGIIYEQQTVIAALHKMVRDDFVEERRDGTQYRIPVGLLKEWLRKAKSPERVVREEGLDEVEAGEES